jgi:RND family efflux transporter MFP subunit
LKSRKAQLERQIVEVAVADRQIALWRQQMEDTVILAPFAGIVTSKNAQQGEMISPMAVGGFTRTGICTIVDMESLEIEIEVNESYINRVEAGQRVLATLDAYPDWQIPAKVVAIIPTADRQKATVKVRVGFDGLDQRILPQMGVKVAFQSTGEAPAATRNIAVPKAAVRQRDGRDVVWLVHDSRVERRAVTLGAARGDEVTIAAGLSSGDKVVVEGPDNLADGAKVMEANQ